MVSNSLCSSYVLFFPLSFSLSPYQAIKTEAVQEFIFIVVFVSRSKYEYFKSKEEIESKNDTKFVCLLIKINRRDV